MGLGVGTSVGQGSHVGVDKEKTVTPTNALGTPPELACMQAHPSANAWYWPPLFTPGGSSTAVSLDVQRVEVSSVMSVSSCLLFSSVAWAMNSAMPPTATEVEVAPGQGVGVGVGTGLPAGVGVGVGSGPGQTAIETMRKRGVGAATGPPPPPPHPTIDAPT